MGHSFLLEIAVLSHPGQVRDLNEDSYGLVEGQNVPAKAVARKGHLYVVADGMGGHAAGEVASRQAVESLFEHYYADLGIPPAESLQEAAARANEAILAHSAGDKAGMGTTLVAAVVKDAHLWVLNVGDSRAYLLRQGEITQLTHDHSWVGDQVEAGILTEKQARQHIYRNVITRSLGNISQVEADLFERELEAGDILVLCTDGLTNLVADEEINKAFTKNSLADAVQNLVDLANARGGADNITLVAVQVQLSEVTETPTEEDEDKAVAREAKDKEHVVGLLKLPEREWPAKAPEIESKEFPLHAHRTGSYLAGYRYPHAHPHRHADRHSHPDQHPHGHRYAYLHTHRYADVHTYPHAHRHTNEHAHGNPNRHLYRHADPHANPYFHAHHNNHTYLLTHSHPYGHA